MVCGFFYAQQRYETRPIEYVHGGHIGGPKQKNDIPLGNKCYFYANIFNCFGPPTWPPCIYSIVYRPFPRRQEGVTICRYHITNAACSNSPQLFEDTECWSGWSFDPAASPLSSPIGVKPNLFKIWNSSPTQQNTGRLGGVFMAGKFIDWIYSHQITVTLRQSCHMPVVTQRPSFLSP